MTNTPHILLLFLDGVGIGKKNPRSNPFFTAELPTLSHLIGRTMIHSRDADRSGSMFSLAPLDATLGLPGLPQSGTGQTALITGVNAPQLAGKHFGPYAHSSLKPVIEERNIFRKLQLGGRHVCYANAFPRQYFDHLSAHSNHATAITLSWLSTGNPLNNGTILERGKAVSADITNERWHTLGYRDLQLISAQEAGRRLVELARNHHFVLFEYFLTDHAGHAQSMIESVAVLQAIDGLLAGVLAHLDMNRMLLIVTSDHGNIEDLSTRSHTRSPVPLLAVGKHHRSITHRARSIIDVAPAILNLLM